MSTKREQKILENSFLFDRIRLMLSKGYTQRQCASELHLSLSKINRVIRVLKIEAKQSIAKYVNEELPVNYQNTLLAINQIIKRLWEQVDQAKTDRDRNASYALLMQALEIRLNLLSSGETLQETISFIDQQQEQTDTKQGHNRVKTGI